jgi:hypothetical protein
LDDERVKRSIFEKIREAERILQEEKEELLEMVTGDAPDDFGSSRDFLSLIEEDAKYRIRALHLPKPLLRYYLRKICDIYGPWSEDQPRRLNKYYDNDLYLKG